MPGGRCRAAGCEAQRLFGVNDGRRLAVYCGRHRLPDMVNVRAPVCEEPGCAVQPSFGWADRGWTLRCGSHRLQGMINLRNQVCATCGLFAVRRKGQLCFTCRRGTERHKQAEHEVLCALQACALLQHYTAYDAALPCLPDKRRFRPDFLWLPSPQLAVILEIDEHEHASYEARCEVARLHQLAEALAPRQVRIVRYNPHAPVKLAGKAHAQVCQLLLLAIAPAALPASSALPMQAVLQGFTGFEVLYAGYTQARIQNLVETQEEMYQELQQPLQRTEAGLLAQ